MAKTKRDDGAWEWQDACRTDDGAYADPAEQLFRNEKMAFLEFLLETKFLSQADRGFLLAYFEYGPGGSGIANVRDFGLVFGMSQGMVVFRLHSLLELLKRRMQILGYRKIDFC